MVRERCSQPHTVCVCECVRACVRACAFERVRASVCDSVFAYVCKDPARFCQLQFVVWFTSWTGNLQKWPSSCPCHQSRFENNITNDCQMKGKLMPIAFKYIMSKLDAALQEAEEWAPGAWSNCYIFLAEAQGSVRACVAQGREMFAFLDIVPYLTSRLSFPGEAHRAIQQYDSVPESRHNRSS